jgi:hypothetical protein
VSQWIYPFFAKANLLIDFGWETLETVCRTRRFFWFPKVETLGQVEIPGQNKTKVIGGITRDCCRILRLGGGITSRRLSWILIIEKRNYISTVVVDLLSKPIMLGSVGKWNYIPTNVVDPLSTVLFYAQVGLSRIRLALFYYMFRWGKLELQVLPNDVSYSDQTCDLFFKCVTKLVS